MGVEPILPWMTMSFFACTVGFAVPAEALAAKDWTLVVLVTILAILSKVGTGLFAAKPMSEGYGLQVLQVGAAMVGRGELGFMQISTAYSIGLVSLGTYGATVWGLLSPRSVISEGSDYRSSAKIVFVWQLVLQLPAVHRVPQFALILEDCLESGVAVCEVDTGACDLSQ